MDGHSGYDQIFIKTFKWVIMPFCFEEQRSHMPEGHKCYFSCDNIQAHGSYIDDMVVKSNQMHEYVAGFREAFERMKQHKLKMNP